MEGRSGDTQEKMGYDISIVRPQMRNEDFKMRGQGMSLERLAGIKKGLLAFHTLETMATNVYKFQITNKPSELNRLLIVAMCNESTHIQDFQVKLYEYGWKPSKLRWAFWIVGGILGFVTRFMGEKAIRKAGTWVETKAVYHYGELLKTIDWDEDTRKVIEKNQADEHGHIDTWK
ncbi:MAG: demethoxyubiquinone hydroxylase family protein [Candidatus Brocadiales bacterium]